MALVLDGSNGITAGSTQLSNSELGYLDGVTSNLQTQINGIIPSKTGNTGKFLTTDGSVVSWADAGAIGVGQTWQDVTASRASNVTYTNTTGKPIQVSIKSSNNTNPSTELTVDGKSVSVCSIASTGGIVSVSAIVPNGSTYKCGPIWSQIGTWLELR